MEYDEAPRGDLDGWCSVITVDLEGLEQLSRATRLLFRDQIPFAQSRAINDSARDVQRVQRAHQREIWTVRRKSFVDRAVKVKPFAKKHSLEAVVRYDPPGGRRRADILTKFESRTVKVSRDGGRIALPTAAVRTPKGSIRKGRRPRDFGLQLESVGPRAAVYRGKKGTFMVKRHDGTGGIFQRVRKRRSRSMSLSPDVKTLYTFAWSARLTPNLNFRENAVRTVRRRFPRHMRRRFLQSIKTAR